LFGHGLEKGSFIHALEHGIIRLLRGDLITL
jgi:hypothetical protein